MHFILLRGLIREQDHWGEFIPALKKYFPNSQLHCIDIPGAGDQHLVKCPLTIKEITQLMREKWSSLNIPKTEKTILLSVSLGGMIAAQWMNDYPQDFTHCVLMNTSFSGLSPLWDRMKPSALLYFLPFPFIWGRAREKRILQLVCNVETRHEGDADSWYEIQLRRPVSFENTIRQLWAATKFRFPKTRPPHSLLVISCPKDRMVSVKCSEIVAKVWNAPIKAHPSGGHDITGDDPHWVAGTISEWITSQV